MTDGQQKTRSYHIVGQVLRTENFKVAIIRPFIRERMKGHLGNIVCADKWDLSILSGGKNRVCLDDSVCTTRLDQIL